MNGLHGFAGMGLFGDRVAVATPTRTQRPRAVNRMRRHGLGGLDEVRELRATARRARELALAGNQNGAQDALAVAEFQFANLTPREQGEERDAIEQARAAVAGNAEALANAAAANTLRAGAKAQIDQGGMFTNPQEACAEKQLGPFAALVPTSLYGKVCTTDGRPNAWSFFDLVPTWAKVTGGLLAVGVAYRVFIK